MALWKLASSVIRCKATPRLGLTSALVSKRGFFYAKERGVSPEFLVKLQRDYDISLKGLRKYLNKKEREGYEQAVKSAKEKQHEIGVHFVAAQFISASGGAVKFEGSEGWIEAKEGEGFFIQHRDAVLEAVDASGTKLQYSSLELLGKLKLKYLNLSRCPKIDDWCLDLVSCDHRESLLVLDLSDCPNITERGLATLHRFKNLRRLTLSNFPKVRHAPLVAMMLEEAMPECYIEGIDYTDETALQNAKPVDSDLHNYIEQLEKFMDKSKPSTGDNKYGIFSIRS